MLSISPPMRGGGSGDYYVKLAQAEYYTAALGPPGQWHGKGARALGLMGEVDPAQLKNLLEGKSPDGTKSLVQVQQWKDRERQSGWDLTLSAPKSVSVLWSQSSADVRAMIEKLHDEAVKKALSFLEREAGVTRRGQGGKKQEKASVVFAMFRHGTSRANDPQLHTHGVLINLSVRDDGSTGALRSKKFFDYRLAAGIVYQLELRRQFHEHLNLEMVAQKVGYGLAEVPAELCREFSKRRRVIEEKLKQSTDQSPQAARKITLQTRPAKEELPADKLFAMWKQTAKDFGWGPEEAKKMIEVAQAQKIRIDPKVLSEEVTWRIEQEIKRVAEKQQAKRKSGAKAHAKQHAHDSEKTKNDRTNSQSFHRSFGKGPKPYFRFERRLLFPRAPEWSPLKTWRIPIPVVGQNKSKAWWGKVRWQANTPLGQLQLRDKYLFPNAPEWSPLKNATIPRFVLRQNTEWKWRENIWKRNTTFGQLQLRKKALFPRAIEGSLAHKLSIPALRLQTKKPEYKIPDMTKQKHSY